MVIAGNFRMSEHKPLYNSRVTRVYIQYLRSFYPDIDTDSVLKMAGIANYEIEDPAHWITQEIQDRLHDILVSKTGDQDIARKAGRFAASSDGLGAPKQYIAGLMSPTPIYLLVEKLYPMMSRGADLKAKKIGPDKVEIISIPKQDVKEKPYQCENRMGMLEALAKWPTNKFANVEHPKCLHRGDEYCRYIVTWEKTAALIWKRIEKIYLLASMLLLIVLFFSTTLKTWGLSLLSCAFSYLLISFFANFFEKKVRIDRSRS